MCVCGGGGGEAGWWGGGGGLGSSVKTTSRGQLTPYRELRATRMSLNV